MSDIVPKGIREIASKRGMAGVITRAYGARDHLATVTGVEYLAPHFVRVRMQSDTLFSVVKMEPTAWLRFWFPDLADPNTEQQRGYTISEANEQAGEFAIDMVLHEPEGPASAWAKKAKPGTTVAVTSLGSTRFDLPEVLPAGYLIMGDAASIPAINAILEVVPAEVPIELYLEQHDDRDREIPLVEHPGMTVHWLKRNGEASFAAALEARDWSGWHAWAAPEVGSLKHLRARLRGEFGFAKSELHAIAYWYYGRAFGSKRPKGMVDD